MNYTNQKELALEEKISEYQRDAINFFFYPEEDDRQLAELGQEGN